MNYPGRRAGRGWENWHYPSHREGNVGMSRFWMGTWVTMDWSRLEVRRPGFQPDSSVSEEKWTGSYFLSPPLPILFLQRWSNMYCISQRRCEVHAEGLTSSASIHCCCHYHPSKRQGSLAVWLPLNNTGLNFMGPLMHGCFSVVNTTVLHDSNRLNSSDIL